MNTLTKPGHLVRLCLPRGKLSRRTYRVKAVAEHENGTREILVLLPSGCSWYRSWVREIEEPKLYIEYLWKLHLIFSRYNPRGPV